MLCGIRGYDTESNALLRVREPWHNAERHSWMCGGEGGFDNVLAVCVIFPSAQHGNEMARIAQGEVVGV